MVIDEGRGSPPTLLPTAGASTALRRGEGRATPPSARRGSAFDAAQIHHPAFAFEIVAVEVHGNVDHRGDGDGEAMVGDRC